MSWSRFIGGWTLVLCAVAATETSAQSLVSFTELIGTPPLPSPAAEVDSAIRRLPPLDESWPVADSYVSLQGDAPTPAAAESRQRDQDQPLGEAPPDNARIFLRQSAVLLESGTIEVEWGIRYLLQESDFLTILPDSSIVQEFTDVRQIFGSFTLRYGWSERLQPWVAIPAGFAWFERASAAGQFEHQQLGLGDILAGVNYLVRDGKDECSDIILGLTVAGPVGDSTFLSLSPDFAPLGNGFWTVGVGLTFVRTYDPVVLFASVGYAHQFEREFFGRAVAPGEEFSYAFGAGLAVNDDITLSTQMQSLVQLDFFIDGQRLSDSATEATVLRHSVIRRVCEQSFVEFFLMHGLTDDAPRINFGVLHTHRY